MAAVSLPIALYLRLGSEIASYPPAFLSLASGLFAMTALAVFVATGLPRAVWRYASLTEMLAIVRAVTIIELLFLPLMFFATRAEDLPRSVPIINWFLLIAFLTGPRIFYRMIRDKRVGNIFARETLRRIPILLVGAGDGTDLFLRQIVRERESAYRPVGILDPRARRVGSAIQGVRILGATGDLPAVVAALRSKGDAPERLVLTDIDIAGGRISELLRLADQVGLPLARMPRPSELKAGVADKLEIRPIAIEDLLGRPQTVLDRPAMAELVSGKKVLVTGAGGTIGGELARQIAALAPAELVLSDNSEHLLYLIELELSESFPGMHLHSALADVRDREGIAALIARSMPDLVFHAAAYKHVPIIEAQPEEGVLTNVVGTRNLADACRANGVLAMVMISTDKAVNPVSVMGATKRLAEMYCQTLDLESSAPGPRPIERPRTRFLTVRFGNVLGSNGSVVPLFQRQLARGGPLTVTHPDMTRYFMTVREAVELVLQASALGCSERQDGTIFVLDMGEPVRIVDLAHQMIRLAGLKPDSDIRIEFIGIRPGERLHEELLHSGEALAPTRYPGVLRANPINFEANRLRSALDELQEAAKIRKRDQVLALVAALVPEYRPAQMANAARG
jgi:FlaA1/EpsC-like NDP-sugar epimerase